MELKTKIIIGIAIAIVIIVVLIFALPKMGIQTLKLKENPREGFNLFSGDYIWNNFYGFNFDGNTMANYNLNSIDDQIASTLMVNYTMTVQNVSFYAQTTGTLANANFSIGLANGTNLSAPSTTWIGATNQGYGIVNISGAMTRYNVTLKETVDLIPGQIYWLIINYSTGTVNSSHYFGVQGSATSLGTGNLNDVKIDYMNNQSIRYMYVSNGGVWTINTGRSLGFKLGMSNTSRWGNLFNANTQNNIYGSTQTFQVFNVYELMNISSAAILTTKVGSPTCDIKFDIVPGIGNSSWKTNSIATCTTDAPTGVSWIGCDFTTVTLSAGTNYTLVISDTPGNCTSSNYFRSYMVQEDFKGYDYNNSFLRISGDNGSTFTNYYQYDTPFRMNMTQISVFTNATVTGSVPTSGQVFLDPSTINFTCAVTKGSENVQNVSLNVFNQSGFAYNDVNTTVITSGTTNVNFYGANVPTSLTHYNYTCNSIDALNTNVSSGSKNFYYYNNSIPSITNISVNGNYGYSWHNITNINNNTVIDYKPFTLFCNFSDSIGIRWAGIMSDKYNLQGSVYYDGDLYDGTTSINYSLTENYPKNVILNLTVEDFVYNNTLNYTDYRCKVQSVNGSYTILNQNITTNITPEIYMVFAIDTETNSLATSPHNQSLDLSNFYPDVPAGNPTCRAFYQNCTTKEPADYRNNLDSHGTSPKLSWFDMMSLQYKYNTNGMTYDPIYNYMLNYSSDIAAYGDDFSGNFHFHMYAWINITSYLNDVLEPTHPNSPYTPSTNYDQAFRFWNDTDVGITNESSMTPQEIFEEAYAYRIINEQEYPTVYRAGWLWEDDLFNHWAEDKLLFDYGVWKGAVGGTSYNWSVVDADRWAPFHPDENNYQLKGTNMSRWMFQCESSNVDADSSGAAINLSYNIGRVPVCVYAHNTGGIDSIYGNIESYNSTLVPLASATVPAVPTKYATAKEASQWFINCTDTTSPTIRISKDNDWIYLNTSEAIYGEPYLAILDTSGNYLRGVIQTDGVDDNGITKWKADRNQVTIDVFTVAVSDLCGNSEVQTEQIVSDVQIIAPTNAIPVSVVYPQNITLQFKARFEGSYITSGLEWINATIGNTLATNTTLITYTAGNIWKINVTIPDLVASQNLTIWVNNTNTNSMTDTEINAVRYDSCTYSGSGNWLVNCSDNCIIASPIALGGNMLIIDGNGRFSVTSSITGISKIIKDIRCRLFKTPSAVISRMILPVKNLGGYI